MTRQTVVVLGASGFIGRRVVAALCATEWARPVAASRHVSRFHFDSRIERVSLDATDPGGLAQVAESASAIVSCIAGSARIVLDSAAALFSAVARIRAPARVVYLSSMAAYGSASGTVEETSPLLGDLGDYSAAKVAAERLGERHSFAVRLRPGIVYGPESAWWSDRIARLLIERRLGDLGDAGQGICNLVHVDDVASAVVRAIELPCAAGEAFNLGHHEPPTWNDYFRRYARALAVAPVKRITRSRLRFELGVRSPALKVAEKILGHSSPWYIHPPIRPWLTRLCKHDIRLDVRKAERLLGMQWRPLDAGLEQTAAWFLSGGRT